MMRVRDRGRTIARRLPRQDQYEPHQADFLGLSVDAFLVRNQLCIMYVLACRRLLRTLSKFAFFVSREVHCAGNQVNARTREAKTCRGYREWGSLQALAVALI